jgi:hypothetical protein
MTGDTIIFWASCPPPEKTADLHSAATNQANTRCAVEQNSPPSQARNMTAGKLQRDPPILSDDSSHDQIVRTDIMFLFTYGKTCFSAFAKSFKGVCEGEMAPVVLPKVIE